MVWLILPLLITHSLNGMADIAVVDNTLLVYTQSSTAICVALNSCFGCVVILLLLFSFVVWHVVIVILNINVNIKCVVML